jgi:predicted GNAT family acetyltransferase
LVAVAGERMKMNDYTEVSAIVTHPNYTGLGYAKQLIAHAVNNIFDQGKIPYLHVVDTNVGAIKLYEKLGFVTRRKMSFWNITR